MGDRANIKIVVDGAAPLYLYTHWGGEELPNTLQDGLIRGETRWNDDSYLARILFSEMISDDINGLTGYGISTMLCDNEHPILSVHPESQTVRLVREGAEDAIVRQWTFREYCALDLGDDPWEVLDPTFVE